MSINATVTVEVRGLWRLRAALWVARASLGLVNWALASLKVQVVR